MQLPAFPDLLFENPYLAVAFGLTVAILVGNLVSMAYWARLEATRREVSTLRVFVYLLTFYGLLHYLYARLVRDPPDERSFPATRRERLVATYTAAATVGVLASFVLAPPDPFTQVAYIPPLFAVGAIGTYLWLSWRRPGRPKVEA
ncbi:hypothetical protein I7X12_13360 [Halosimplex litoreum]|uniref:Uncharacterized protein n=1 Tax=Halosimplex litoreum TaxID=1198301 RepID=A0A7T3FVZ0_9EURY|nr:hypothetical protein [Halosimplex litoreum]QPV61735.1 hypothetical protein I7X12_13360 [Halosimplex litoreum]